ncbi:MAG: molybdopterin-dependent oxidoreductase [Desulfurococcaceae archaeon]
MSIGFCYETSSSGLLMKGISKVVDCPVEGLAVSGVNELRDLISRVIARVLSFQGIHYYDIVFESSEPIGYTHSLHKFRLFINGRQYIGIRAVVRGKKLIRILFTIPIGTDVEIKSRVGKYDPVIEKLGKGTCGGGEGIPPGQVYIDIPVVYAILGVPRVDVSKWTLRVEGEVGNAVELSLLDLYKLGVVDVETDFHCVTGWSVKSVKFAGVPLARIAELVVPKEGVNWVYVEGADGYSTVFPYIEVYASDAIVALEMNGKPLDVLHGYPARLVIPHLYGWKSAKWITRMVFTRDYSEGYWEALGYHPRGMVQFEERFKTR